MKKTPGMAQLKNFLDRPSSLFSGIDDSIGRVIPLQR